MEEEENIISIKTEEQPSSVDDSGPPSQPVIVEEERKNEEGKVKEQSESNFTPFEDSDEDKNNDELNNLRYKVAAIAINTQLLHH